MDVKEETNQTAHQFSDGPPQGKLAPEGLTSAAPSLPAQAWTDGRAVASRSGTSSALHAVKSVGANTLVEINQLRKSFGSHEVLKGIDLEVKAGEVIAIIGKSGSGKSTLLRCINGLEEFQSGTLRVDGKHLLHDNPHVMRDLRQRVGMIFQSFNLFPHLTVGKNIMLAPTLVKKTAGAPAQEQARALLQRVGLAEKFDAWPDQLSGGQQQRVAIARALAMQPSVLLCDEITSALDPELVGEVLQVVESLAAEGMTLLMVTHEMNFARKVADRLVFMHQGRVHEIGPPDEVFSNPQTPELKQFLGMIQ